MVDFDDFGWLFMVDFGWFVHDFLLDVHGRFWLVVHARQRGTKRGREKNINKKSVNR
jgi:hypothetical protein